ncbi:MAG: GlsB/YeaQ/YmgE family stress response membrane protein [Candidatus Acidiferrales bacterium]
MVLGIMNLSAALLLLEKEYDVNIFVRHSFLGWIFIGLIAGWLTGKITRGAGFGCIGDVLLGLVGALLGGWIFGKLGIFGGGFIYSLAAAVVGAVLLVSIAHIFSKH